MSAKDPMMSSVGITHGYFDAWNTHDPAAIVKMFAEGGTYCDPVAGIISGDAIGAYARSLGEAFPDLAFEIVSCAEANSGKVVAEWIMKGTNAGTFMGLPATRRTVALSGVDVLKIEHGSIRSVRGYFDTRVIPEQLGLQVVIQPQTAGPFSFGVSTAVQSGKKVKPGAFCITSIWNADAATEEIRALSRDTAAEMLHMEGFIGVALLRIGGRGVTISAWEKPEQTKQVMRDGAHAEAMRRFWAELSDSAFTSVWVPARINPLWVRCPACRRMNDYEKNSGVCSCGTPLPDAHPYF